MVTDNAWSQETLLLEHDDKQDPWILFAQAESMAFDADSRESIRKIYDALVEQRQQPQYHVRYHVPEAILLLQDDHAFRSTACARRLNQQDLDEWERVVIRYAGDELSDEELLRKASSSEGPLRLMNLARAEKLVAMKHLLLGDRDSGIEHLRACLSIQYYGEHTDWARAFWKRLEADENWP